MTTERARLYLLLVLSTVFFAAGIGQYDLWSPDEPRFAQAAREMMQRGDYLAPHVNARPYMEKPPLLFWLMALCAAPFGDVNEITARIPSVAAGVVTVGMTYLLALRVLRHTRFALWAALILMTNLRFWWQARFGQIDMLLTACMTTGLYALWRFDETRDRRWLFLLYGAVAAGLLAKGPPALVFPLLFIIAFYWGDREGRRRTHWVAGFLAAMAVAALWYVPARMAVAGTIEQAAEQGIAANLFRNTIGRLVYGVSHAQPPWYYLTTIPVDLMPWSLLLPWTLTWIWRNRHGGRPMRFLLSYTVPALIFFSISVGKREVYLLPLWPAFAMLLAASLRPLLDEDHPRWRSGVAAAWALLLMVVGAAPLAVRQTVYAQYLTTPVLLFCALAFLCGLIVLLRAFRTGLPNFHFAMSLPFAVLALTAPFSLLPAVNVFKSAKDICAPVRLTADNGVDFELYSVAFSREPYIFYSHHPHEERFMELVGLDPSTMSFKEFMEAAKDQRTAHRRIKRAVDAVPVANLGSITPEERAALRAAIEQAVNDAEEDAESLRAFETMLIREIDLFLEEFVDDRPAFMYVQDEDWRWILPLANEPPALHVIGHEQVGSREVLLLGNDGAAEAAHRLGLYPNRPPSASASG
jgi:4-amino-4-deoxy-L-arabinose transferase-like glycosyltransferase